MKIYHYNCQMEQNKKSARRRDIAISTQNFSLNQSHHASPPKQKTDDQSPSKSQLSTKSEALTIKEYEKKISAMSQTILKLTKKNQDQKQEFRILNQKLNKAFSKLTPNKLKSVQEKSQQTISLTQQLQKVKKELQNEMKKSKQLKKQLQVLKETQNLLNNQDTYVQLKNQLVQKQRQIKQLKQIIKVYERAEENEKKMTHFKKEQELNKKLHQLNEQNIYMKKKMTELKAKIQESQKVKAMEKAEAVLEKSMKPKKANESQQWVKKEVHDEEILKLQEQIKIYESVKNTLEKTHKQECDALRKQNQILNDDIDELKMEIRKKNKQKFMLQQRTQQLSQMKKSRIEEQRSSLTIDIDDKNQRYKTFSLNHKSQPQTMSNGLRKQFLGLSYGNFGNDYKKHDDSLKLDDSKFYMISSIQFIYFEEHILSLKVKYKYSNGQQNQLYTFDLDHNYTNTKTAQLIFQDHEYIKQLDIYCNKMVEFIQLKTSRNQTLEIGNEKNQVKSKKYSFDIKNHQKPIAFGSITEVKKAGDTKKQCLVVLGLIIKKKDISINKKRILVNSKHQSLNQKDMRNDRSDSIVKDKKFLNQNEQHKNDSLSISFVQKQKQKANPNERQKINVKEKEKNQQNKKKQEKTTIKPNQKTLEKTSEKVKQKEQSKNQKLQKQKQDKIAQSKASKQKSPQKTKLKVQESKPSESPLQNKSKVTLKK